MKTNTAKKINAFFLSFLMIFQSAFSYGFPSENAQMESLTLNNSPLTINKEGVIGKYGDKQLDNPADNYFELWLEEEPTEGQQVYLVYELEGVADYHSVARSLNDELSLGGHWVRLSDEKSIQREPINPQSIKQGENTVLFSLPENADYGYKVRNLRFEIVDNATMRQCDNAIITALSHNENIYIKGFVSKEVKELKAQNTIIKTHNGNFEAELSKEEAKQLTLVLADGTEELQQIEVQNIDWLDYRHEIEAFGETRTALFEVEKANELALEGSSITADKQISKQDQEISVTTLRHNDLPALDMGLNNVTATHKGYRFLPHGEHFADSGAVVKIAYDKLSLPSGFTEKDINAYYFDPNTGHWATLQKDSVDTQNSIIYARTTHFTDMIAGVIQAPESPETAGFAPTMMTGIKAADPTAKVGLIAPPQANNRGTAGLQYPFEMPPARNGMTPSLALSYNSDGGSGWAGMGWDLQIPSIGVETRWGVPRYHPDKETETYLMDGQMLGFLDGDELHLAHRHKEKKDRKSDRRFYPRKEGSFSKIIRKGNKLDGYTWEVSDKNGTVYTYGGNNGILKGTITDIEGNSREVISEWKLSKVQEKHGDYIEYFYEQKTEAVKGSLTAEALYLTKIVNNTGTEVLFDSQSIKEKKTNNARYGFLVSSHQLLDKITINFEDEILRSYALSYKDGAFHTKLLDKVVHIDSKGNEFAAHAFDYYDDVNQGGSLRPFQENENWDLHDDDIQLKFINPGAILNLPQFREQASALDGTKGKTNSSSIFTGIGVKGISVGASFSYSDNRSEGLNTLIDLNGDALPDKVFMASGKLFFRPQSQYEGRLSYGEAIEVQGIHKISKTTVKTTSGGNKENLIIGTLGNDWSKTKTETKVYFTDVNGDGLPDLVDNGAVYFNRIEKDAGGNLIPTFEVGSQLTPAPIQGGGEIDIAQFEPTQEEKEEAVRLSPMQDVVRVWEAPFDGKVNITSSVKLLQAANPANEDGYDKADGVRVAIQVKGSEKWHKSIAKDDANTHVANLSNLAIEKGDCIYFRVQSGGEMLSNGTYDRVTWNPEISYANQSNEGTPYGYSSIAYKASEGQVISKNESFFIGDSTNIAIKSHFEKPLTSDRVILRVYRTNDPVLEDGKSINPDYQRVVVWEKSFDGASAYCDSIQFEIPGNNMLPNLEFEVTSPSNVAWEKVKWKPVAEYMQKGTAISLIPDVYYDIKARHHAKAMPFALGSDTSIYKITPKITTRQAANGTLTMVVKKEHEFLARKEIRLQNGIANPGDYVDTLHTSSGKIWVEYYGDDSLIEKLDSLQASIYTASGITNTKADVYSRRTEEGFGAMHRHWGQFVYNASGDRYSKPIDESLLKLPEGEEANLDPLTTAFVPLMPDYTKSYRVGRTPYAWMKGDTLTAARLGEQDVVLSNPFDGIDMSEGFNAFGVSQKNESKSFANMSGLGGASHSFSTGEDWVMLSFQDMNGDAYPDILGKNSIDYTNHLGGFENERLAEMPNHSGKNEAEGLSLSGVAIHSISATTGKKNSNKAKQGSLSSSLGKVMLEAAKIIAEMNTPAINKDATVETYLDLNGDGLPDKILSDKSVRLNLGYAFSEAVDWEITTIQKGKSETVSIDRGVSKMGVNIGFGITSTESEQAYKFMDVNADGLLDKVRIAEEKIYVCLNTGTGFDHEFMWSESVFGTSSATSESINTGGSVSIPIIPPVCLVINASYSSAQSMSRSLTALRDVDGDGYPDFVASDEDKSMSVKRSTIARTGKLKTVQNPLGGSFTLDYKRSPATYDHPGGKWVMASLEVNDGLADDGANSLTHFDYADGKRDRYEREFLGFGKMISKQMDTENENALYRSIEQTYDVSNYYTAGNAIGSTLKDAQGKIYTQSTQQYYTYKVSASGDSYSFLEAGNINKLNSPMVFSPLRFTQNENHEGGSEKAILQQAHYAYRNGATGELASYKFSDKGALAPDGSGSFNYQTSISYTNPNTSKRILGLPQKVQVKGSDGKLYRETTAKYDDLGRITEVAQTLENGKAISNFEWNKFGSITKRTLPGNSTGQRMWYSYRYERDYHMYIERIEDAWGYRSELEDYDYRYGVALRTKDMNGYYQEQQIDHMGRITEITAPNELAEGVPYTIRFSYPESYTASGLPHVALTAHYDPEHPDDAMNTSTFVDGFGRAIQVKKDGVVANGNTKEEVSIVSGRAWFDAFGRATKAWYPTTAPLNEHAQFSDAFDDVSPTLTTFDVMDRATNIQMPDGTESSKAYSVVGNLQKVKTTDANGSKQASYTNGSGLNIKTEQLSGPDGTITTLFEYDAINQLLKAIDTEGNAIVSAYDKGGRRTSVTHPDAGTTRFTYDNLGNVLTRQTANLADTGQLITYAYDYHRLTEINYPLNPENNVRYHYGNAHANHNRIGRLAMQEDATGAQEFYYGRLGEVTKIRRTHIIPNHAVATFETTWKYDSWNRVQEMVYPDKEKLSYHYDAGGQLEGLTGNKAYSYNYVQDIGYDKFGQRSYIKYCNGTETTYDYDPQMRRLQGLQAKNQSTVFMDNAYSFDDVGNILSVSNNASPPSGGGGVGGQMSHSYTYDGLYRLTSAEGTYTGADSKTAAYSLEMAYDNLHNITSKKQHITQTDIAFEGNLMAGYELEYNYSDDKPHQLATIEDVNYRTADSTAVATNTQALSDAYHYDSNGNLVYVNTSDTVQTQMKERKLSWDEENRLRAICDNGYVSSYFYDAGGERTVKLHGSGEGIHVNGVFSGGYTNNHNYTLYVNAYMVLEKGGQYTKHIYIGDQRIVSKLGDVGSFGVDPRRVEYAGEDVAGTTVPDYATKYTALQDVVKDNYARFEVDYYAIDNDDYVNGEGFCCDNSSPQLKSIPVDNVDYEKLQYYYHSDHLGSASYITNLDGEVVQHVEYVPFGEVFIEERNNTWNTPYLFNGKELDEETGLYYYGARYYNPKTSQFLSTDRYAEKYPSASPYQYCLNNPINAIDVNGDTTFVAKNGNIINAQRNPETGKLVDNMVYMQNDDGGYNQIGELGGNIDINTIMENKLAESKEEAKSIDGLYFSDNNYKEAVEGGSDWDLKANTNTIFGLAWEEDEKTTFNFGDHKGMNSADVGNYHAGYVGTYAYDGEGIHPGILLLGAGVAEVAKNLGNTLKGDFRGTKYLLPWNNTLGDRDQDAIWNIQGMMDANREKANQ